MRLVPRLHALDEVRGDDLADGAAAQKRLHLGVEGGVAQDMADHDAATQPPGGLADGQRVFPSMGDWLLEQEVAAQFHGP